MRWRWRSRSMRNVVAYDRDMQAGKWHYLSSGVLRRARAS